jgi:hypothetical protein
LQTQKRKFGGVEKEISRLRKLNLQAQKKKLGDSEKEIRRCGKGKLEKVKTKCDVERGNG